jgi:hypothetical protein
MKQGRNARRSPSYTIPRERTVAGEAAATVNVQVGPASPGPTMSPLRSNPFMLLALASARFRFLSPDS